MSTMLSNAGRFRDRNPDITAAGKLMTSGDCAKDCLLIRAGAKTPDNVAKFRGYTQPPAAMPRIFYGRANDPDTPKRVVHGVITKPSMFAGDLVSPPPKSLFSQRLKDKKEALYASRKNCPLGQCHDQLPGLPEGIGPYDSCFGVKNFKDCTSGELVNPAKSRDQVNHESAQGKELYKVSHSDYEVGETYDRKYDWSRVKKNSIFGIETPHNNDGIHVRKTLKWLHETQSAKAAQIVSKRVDAFRERTQPQLGRVHDPIKETLRVHPSHTFGIMLQPDEYGAGDLIHMRTSRDYLRGRDRERGVLAAVRQHLKKANYHNFHDLYEAFKFYDKDNNGKITVNELKEICIQFNLPVEPELLDLLLRYCDANGDGVIDYLEFANFLNWKDKMSASLPLRKIENDSEEVPEQTDTEQPAHSPEPKLPVLKKQIDRAVGGWNPSSTLINAHVGAMRTRDWRSYGVPTIRSDLPAPRIRRVGDNKNYGDESDAYGLINPSIYSNHGVYEKDFFQPRSRFEIRRIIDGIGVAMSQESFQKIWEMAASRNPKGEVSLESFRGIMDEMSSQMYKRAHTA